MDNIFEVSRFFEIFEISTKNINFSKPQEPGSTLARLAMVLILLSIGNTPALRVIMFQTGGKPSTWFPPVGLVELYFPSNALFMSSIQEQKFS